MPWLILCPPPRRQRKNRKHLTSWKTLVRVTRPERSMAQSDYYIREDPDRTFSVVNRDRHVWAERIQTREEAEAGLAAAQESAHEQDNNDIMVDKIEEMLDANPYANGRAQVLAWLILGQEQHFPRLAKLMSRLADEFLDTTHDG